MVVCICILKEDNIIAGYRLYDTDGINIKDVSIMSIINNIDKVENLELSLGNIKFKGNQEHLYPVLHRDTGEVVNADSLIYIGKRKFEQKAGGCSIEELRWLVKPHTIEYIEKRYFTFINWEGTERSIKYADIQDGILKHNLLNIAESYTGPINKKYLNTRIYGVYDSIYSISGSCFMSISEVYRLYNKISKYKFIKYRSRTYDIDKQRGVRLKKGEEAEDIEVDILYNTNVCRYLKSQKSIAYKYAIINHQKLPLKASNNIVTYIDMNEDVIEEDIYSYISSGVVNVFNGTSLLDQSRESSGCMVTATDIILLTFRDLIFLDIEENEKNIQDSIMDKQSLSRRIKLVGNDDIEIDNNGRVSAYRVEDGSVVMVNEQMTEFDLRNIKVKGDRYKHKSGIVVDIPDEHGLIYISGNNVYAIFKGIKCNDTELVKKLACRITRNYSTQLEWQVSASKITLGIIKWVDKAKVISLCTTGSLSARNRDNVLNYILEQSDLDTIQVVKKRIAKNPYEVSVITNEWLIGGTEKFGKEYKYAELSCFEHSLNEGIRSKREVYRLEADSEFRISSTTGEYASKMIRGYEINYDEHIVIDLVILLNNYGILRRKLDNSLEYLSKFKSIDEKIGNVYGALLKDKEDFENKDEVYYGSSLYTSQFGVIYKRDIDRGVKALCVYNMAVDIYLYLKYTKVHITSNDDIDILAEEHNLSGDSYNKTDHKEIINSLPDEVYITCKYTNYKLGITPAQASWISTKDELKNRIREILEAERYNVKGSIELVEIKGFIPCILVKGDKHYDKLIDLGN